MLSIGLQPVARRGNFESLSKQKRDRGGVSLTNRSSHQHLSRHLRLSDFARAGLAIGPLAIDEQPLAHRCADRARQN